MLTNISKAILICLALNSCALFKKNSKYLNQSCPDEKFLELTEIAEESFVKLKSCLQKFKRDQDVFKLEQIATNNKAITLRCEQKNKNIHVLIDPKNAKSYPSFNINVNNYSPTKEVFKKEFFHETAHLLGYEHAQNFDLTEIAEMCCWSNEKNLKISAKSCDLFKYSNSQWVELAYLKQFNESLFDFGNVNLALKTSVAASVYHAKKKDYLNSQAAILSLLKPISKNYTRPKMNRQIVRELKKESGVVTSLIVSKLGFASNNSQDLISSRQTYNALKKYFYNAPIELEKLNFFEDISQTINSLMLLNSTELIKNWIKLRDRGLYLCRDLNETELSSIEAILSLYNPLLFSIKTEIPAGEFYEIATYWSKPCELQKSYNSNN